MQFLTDSACVAWCEERAYRIAPTVYGRHAPALREYMAFTELPYPEDSGQKVAFARDVVTWALTSGACLVWVREFGVWPSSEHRPLYDRFRQALGDTAGLGDASGHLASGTDRDDAISVAAMALLFFWDVYVLPEKNGSVFFASHDEYAGFYGPIPEQLLAEWYSDDDGTKQ